MSKYNCHLRDEVGKALLAGRTGCQPTDNNGQCRLQEISVFRTLKTIPGGLKL